MYAFDWDSYLTLACASISAMVMLVAAGFFLGYSFRGRNKK